MLILAGEMAVVGVCFELGCVAGESFLGSGWVGRMDFPASLRL